MKRIHVILDQDLLKEATQLSGERTYSKAIELALRDFVRRIKARQIFELQGSGLWVGDLGAMRGEATKPVRKKGRGTKS